MRCGLAMLHLLWLHYLTVAPLAAYCVDMATSLFNKTDPNSLTNCTGGQEGHIVNMMRFFGYEKDNLTIDALKKYFKCVCCCAAAVVSGCCTVVGDGCQLTSVPPGVHDHCTPTPPIPAAQPLQVRPCL